MIGNNNPNAFGLRKRQANGSNVSSVNAYDVGSNCCDGKVKTPAKSSGKGRRILSVLFVAFLLAAGTFYFTVDRKLTTILKMFIYPFQSLLIDPVAPIDFQIADLPDGIHEMILHELESKDVQEESHSGNAKVDVTDTIPILYGNIKYTDMTWETQRALTDSMFPVMEKFCNCKLDNQPVIHGIRLYQNGSSVTEHLDWPDAWVVSATILIRNKGNPWPILVRNGRQYFLGKQALPMLHQPGQAVLYQGSRIWHSREPYDGDEYAAIFLGYLPENYPEGTSLSTRIVYQLSRMVKGQGMLNKMINKFKGKWNIQ